VPGRRASDSKQKEWHGERQKNILERRKEGKENETAVSNKNTERKKN
jgi:hypothetical protein